MGPEYKITIMLSIYDFMAAKDRPSAHVAKAPPGALRYLAYYKWLDFPHILS